PKSQPFPFAHHPTSIFRRNLDSFQSDAGTQLGIPGDRLICLSGATLGCEKTRCCRHGACCVAARVLAGKISYTRCRAPVCSRFPGPSHSHHCSRTRSAWHSQAASVRRAEWCSVPSLCDGAAVEAARHYLELHGWREDHSPVAGGQCEVDRRSDFERPAEKDRPRRTRPDRRYATANCQRWF